MATQTLQNMFRRRDVIIAVTAVHGIRPYRDDCLVPPFCFLYRTRKQERKTCSVYILIARVQGRIKRYRGSRRKGDGLRCEGGGGGGGLGDNKEVQVVDKCHDKIIQRTSKQQLS